MQQPTNRRTIRAVASIAALAATGIASANILISITSPTQYNYIVHKVPDFDQRRIGLTENGDSYCVPTSALNWFAYIANHGYPNLNPGPGDWSQQSKFETVTNNLIALGVLMNTNPASGTNLSGAVNGASAWVGASPYPGQFVVIGKNSDSTKSYRFDDLAQQAMLGRLVMPRIGWYDMTNYPVMVRDGGHLTCLTAAVRNGSSRFIGLNDPASHNGNLAVQSEFTREDYSILEAFPIVGGLPRPMSRLQSYSSEGKGGWIDGYRAIVPLFGLTTSPDNTGVVMKKPFAFGSAQPTEVGSGSV